MLYLALIPAAYAAIFAWLTWEVRKARRAADERERREAMAEQLGLDTPYHVFVIVDHDQHEVRVVDDGRIWRFYFIPGWELRGVLIDPTGPVMDFRKAEAEGAVK